MTNQKGFLVQTFPLILPRLQLLNYTIDKIRLFFIDSVFENTYFEKRSAFSKVLCPGESTLILAPKLSDAFSNMYLINLGDKRPNTTP